MTSVAPSPAPGSPDVSPPALRGHRAPLVGIVAGLAFAVGLTLWTAQRIGEAKTNESDVAARRSAERDRAAGAVGQPQTVHVVQGVTDRWLPRVELDGTLEAVRDSQLGFKVGGRLARVAVKIGDRVGAGALLAALDDAEATAQAAAAEAQMRAAQSSLKLTEDAERRMLPLVENGSMPEANGVQASEQRQLAAAQLDAARAQHVLARTALGSHQLKAPFAGTITQAPTGIGAVVGAGQPLFGLVDTTGLQLKATVSEEDANLLVRGAEVQVAAGGGDVTGRISAVLSTLDARTRRVPVVVDFDNSRPNGSAPLRAGSFVRGWVVGKEPISVLRLPHEVQRPGSRDEVWVVDAASRLQVRHLAFAIAPDGALLVRNGLSPSERVVMNPIPELKAGEVVQVQGEQPQPGATAKAQPAAASKPAPANTKAPTQP